MSDAPERIAVWPDFVGHPSMTGQWSANTHPDNAVAYVRADLSDALLREAMAALDDARGLLVDAMVQLTDGKIKTRRNRALLIQDFLSRDKEQTND